MMSIHFADNPLDPITNDCVSDTARYRQSELSFLPLIPHQIEDKLPSDRLVALVINLQILASSKNMFTSWKLILARHK